LLHGTCLPEMLRNGNTFFTGFGSSPSSQSAISTLLHGTCLPEMLRNDNTFFTGFGSSHLPARNVEERQHLLYRLRQLAYGNYLFCSR
jgi:hypothetical protein